jgi:tRNA ligase
MATDCLQKEPPQITKKPKPLEYVSITLPKTPILEALETAFASVSSNKGRFFRQLQETRRVQPEFHVTLIHRASSKSHPELWQKYSDMHFQSGGDPWSGGSKMGQCKVLLERVSNLL